MRMGLFDVIGPIIHGPSSNHTGGANRIGYMAYSFMGGTPEHVDFYCHPILFHVYAGHHTDVSMLAGCMGIREYDELSARAGELARERGISYEFHAMDASVNRNALYVHAELDGFPWEIDAISPGGAFIEVIAVNGVPVYYDGGNYVYYYADPGLRATDAGIALICQKLGLKPVSVHSGEHAGYGQVFIELSDALSPEAQSSLVSALGFDSAGPAISRAVAPIRSIVVKPGAEPCYDSFVQMQADAEKIGILQAAFKYEYSLSGSSPERIMEEAYKEVEVEEISTARGLQGGNQLIGGFASGSDAKKVADFGKSGRSICGPVFNAALAKAMAMNEIGASAGRIVATPTSGSSGTLPGTLFAVAERYQSSRQQLAESYVVAALLGCLMSKHCIYSGSAGGCMGEVGAAAAMAAGGAAYLAGGTPAEIINACAIALKNSFGLTCDQPVAPVEIPCIKRNAMGASLALMGAELALAGVESYIPMDDVIIAFRNVQDNLPGCLRNDFTGGLAVTDTAKRMQAQWKEKLAAMNAEKK